MPPPPPPGPRAIPRRCTRSSCCDLVHSQPLPRHSCTRLCHSTRPLRHSERGGRDKTPSKCLTTTLPAAMDKTSVTLDPQTPRAVSIAATAYAAMAPTTRAIAASMMAALRPHRRRSTRHVRPPTPIPSRVAKTKLAMSNTVAPVVPIISHLLCAVQRHTGCSLRHVNQKKGAG